MSLMRGSCDWPPGTIASAFTLSRFSNCVGSKKNFWVFKATVFKTAKCRGFVGYGDAHPGNVSPLIFNHAEMRTAETRAVNRALRKAYGIALCSVEELPPWALTPQQIPQLRRDLQSPSAFAKGAPDAHQNSRPQPDDERSSLVEGACRARVVRFGPAGHAAKPCLAATFLILEPAAYAGCCIRTRLYCHDRALWKLRWFLRAFRYDAELFAAEELDDRHVVGLEGVIRLAYWGDARRRLDVEGFAFSERWGQLSGEPQAGRAAPKWRRFKPAPQEGRELWIITATRSFPPICNVRSSTSITTWKAGRRPKTKPAWFSAECFRARWKPNSWWPRPCSSSPRAGESQGYAAQGPNGG